MANDTSFARLVSLACHDVRTPLATVHGFVKTLARTAELEEAFERARAADRTTVIAIETAPDRWTPGGAFWEVGVAEVSERAEVAEARERLREAKERQRVGW